MTARPGTPPSWPSMAAPGERALGPAMRLMLTLAAARTRVAGAPPARRAIQDLWALAERHHPEQAWLAASWLRRERTMEELERQAPREGLAPALQAYLSGRPALAQELRARTLFAQE